MARKAALAKTRGGKGRGPVAVSLGADLRIGQAGNAFARILAARNAGEVVIDGGEVAGVDAAGLQALAAALVTLRTAGVPWTWQARSGTLSAAAALAGLDATLQIE